MGNYVIYFHHNREILLIFSYITIMSHIHRIRAAITTNQNCHITVD